MKLLALLAPLVFLACATTPRGGERWIVASDLDNLPFAGMRDGRPVGRDVEMMEELARRADVELEWRRMPFEELFDAVERGEVDLVCATIGVTEERRRRVEFSEPYYETEIAVVCRHETLPGDLAGKRVGAGRGTTSEAAARRELPRAVLVLENKSGGSTLERLMSGELDAAVMDGPAADALIEASSGKLRRFERGLGPERYALVLRKEDAGLREVLDAQLGRMEGEGWMEALDRRYGLEGPGE